MMDLRKRHFNRRLPQEFFDFLYGKVEEVRLRRYGINTRKKVQEEWEFFCYMHKTAGEWLKDCLVAWEGNDFVVRKAPRAVASDAEETGKGA